MDRSGVRRLSVGALLFAAGATLFGAALADALMVEPFPDGRAGASAGPTEAGPRGSVDRPGGGGGEAAAAPDAKESPGPVPAGGLPSPPTSRALAAAPSQGGGAGLPSAGAVRQVTQEEILEAVQLDLFLPTRTAPPQPYLLPSERRPVTSRREPQRSRTPQLRVVGTAVAGDFGLAMVQVGDTFPRAVVLGEAVEGYVLASVEPDRVVFQREEETLALPVVALQDRRSAQNRQGAGRTQAPTTREMEELRGQVQEMLRNLLPGGGRGGGMAGPGQGAVIRIPGGGVVELSGPEGQLPGAILEALRQQGQIPPGAPVQVIRRPGGGGAP